MRTTRYANEQWGNKPIQKRAEPYTAYKYMQLNRPLTDEFGGHWSLTGSYGHSFFNPMMVAVCGNHRDHAAPDKNCSCGIYSQTLQNIHDGSDFHSEGSLCELSLPGRVLKGSRGYRSSHALITRIWPGVPDLTDEDVSKIQRDLNVDVSRIPDLGQNGHNYRSANDWNNLVRTDPYLISQLKKEQDERQRKLQAEGN